MPCYHPLRGWRSQKVGANGRRPIVFKRSEGFVDMPELVPCGQCVGCRLKRSRDWAVRCVHEASMHEDCCFITLTFSDEFLPDDMSVSVRDMQLFMKRLRKAHGKVRFVYCGEYGEEFARPHYHALLFGVRFDDLKLLRSSGGVRLYTSEALERLWPYGFSTVGEVTFESAAYVARYSLKKITGDLADDHYEYVDPDTGVISRRQPEFFKMSLKPGIGAGWYAKYCDEVFPNDHVVVGGRKMSPPRYYYALLEKADGVTFDAVKIERFRKALKESREYEQSRLNAKEKVALAKLLQTPRKLE